MNVSRFAISILLSAVSTGYGQPIYQNAPDWVSTDTPYSTGGALIDVDQDGWLDFVVANGNDMRREKMAVYYGRDDGTLPLNPDWQSDDLEYNGHLSIADVFENPTVSELAIVLADAEWQNIDVEDEPDGWFATLKRLFSRRR